MVWDDVEQILKQIEPISITITEQQAQRSMIVFVFLNTELTASSRFNCT